MNRFRVLTSIRYTLPAIIVTVAVLLVAIRGVGDLVALEAAAMLAGAGLSVFLLNWLYRVGVDGEADRDREEAAREFLDAHGHWPDEGSSVSPRRR